MRLRPGEIMQGAVMLALIILVVLGALTAVLLIANDREINAASTATALKEEVENLQYTRGASEATLEASYARQTANAMIQNTPGSGATNVAEESAGLATEVAEQLEIQTEVGMTEVALTAEALGGSRTSDSTATLVITRPPPTGTQPGVQPPTTPPDTITPTPTPIAPIPMPTTLTPTPITPIPIPITPISIPTTPTPTPITPIPIPTTPSPTPITPTPTSTTPLPPGLMVICHRSPGNPNNTETRIIPINAWPAHRDHGDKQGPCPDERSSSPFSGTVLGYGGEAPFSISDLKFFSLVIGFVLVSIVIGWPVRKYLLHKT